MNAIKRIVPSFTIKDVNVRILSDPKEFYQFLKLRANTCSKRIIVASLYLGTGDLETSLIDSIDNSIKSNVKNKDFRVHLLFDNNRGSRPVIGSSGKLRSSRTMCQPLLSGMDNIRVSLYHTPNLRGYLHKWLPNRVNEVIGLQHMKIYLFDDCVLLSGANLSADYFTNRQDRYVVFENCPELCDFYEELVNIVGSMSYRMSADNELTPPQYCDPIAGDFNEYISKFRAAIEEFIQIQMVKSKSRELSTMNDVAEGVTQVYPLIQMGLYGVHQDQNVLHKLFTSVSSEESDHYSVALASGYFNLDDDNERLILNLARKGVSVEILTAHPEANGFFQAKGTSGYIPDVYNDILRRFLHKSEELKIKTYEWGKPEWTFHAKGFWIRKVVAGHPTVAMTLIGSTNYGYRSCYRDLETEILIETQSARLGEQLQTEKEALFADGRRAEQTIVARLVPYWIHWVVPMVRHFF